jgi:hypothetical protein
MSRILDFPTPLDERWSIRVDPGPDTLELVATGPERGKEAQLGWQAERVREGVQYRRLLRGRDDRRPEAMRRALRSLIWHRIVFRPNPIVSIDPALAEAFEETVWEALRQRRQGAVQVHFNVWQEDGDVRFVCKVEALPNGSAEAGRRWWSPLVRDPEELAAALAAAYPRVPGDDALVSPTAGSLKRSASLTALSGA